MKLDDARDSGPLPMMARIMDGDPPYPSWGWRDSLEPLVISATVKAGNGDPICCVRNSADPHAVVTIGSVIAYVIPIAMPVLAGDSVAISGLPQ